MEVVEVVVAARTDDVLTTPMASPVEFVAAPALPPESLDRIVAPTPTPTPIASAINNAATQATMMKVRRFNPQIVSLFPCTVFPPGYTGNASPLCPSCGG